MRLTSFSEEKRKNTENSSMVTYIRIRVVVKCNHSTPSYCQDGSILKRHDSRNFSVVDRLELVQAVPVLKVPDLERIGEWQANGLSKIASYFVNFYNLDKITCNGYAIENGTFH